MKKHKKAIGRRVIAFSLAILLLFVPFSSNWGKTSKVKAEDSDPISDCYPTHRINSEPDMKSGIVIGEAEAAEYFVADAPNEIPTFTIHTLDSSVKALVSPNVGFSNTEEGVMEMKKEGDNFDGVIKGYDITLWQGDVDVDVKITPIYTVKYRFEYGYLPYTDTPDEYLAADFDTSSFEATPFTMDGANSKYVLYVKPVVVSAELTDAKCEPYNPRRYWVTDTAANFDQAKPLIEANTTITKYDSTWMTDANSKAIYRLQQKIEYKVDDFDAKWNAQGGVDIDGNGESDVFTSAQLDVGKYDKYTNSEDFAEAYLGEVRYSIAWSDIKTTMPEFSTWGRDTSAVVTDESGYYYGAIEYCIGDKVVSTTLSKEILIDKSAPTIMVMGLYQRETAILDDDTEGAAGDGAEGESGSDTNEGNTTPVETWKHIDVSDGYKITPAQAKSGMYRYVVKATDASKVAAVKYHSSQPNKSGNFEVDSDNQMGLIDVDSDNQTDINEVVYYYTIAENDVPGNKNGEFKLYAEAEDVLGNKTGYWDNMISPTLKLFDGKLTISADFYINNNHVDEIPKHCNKPVKVVISAQSENPICKFEVKSHAGSGQADTDLYTAETPVDFKNKKDVIRDGNGTIYSAEYAFELPAELVNQKMDQIVVSVYDGVLDDTGAIDKLTKNPVTKTWEDFVYDATLPEFILDKEPDNTKWYQNFTLSGEINTGADKNFEDEFEYARYYMKADGNVDLENDTYKDILENDKSAKSKRFSFDVAQSTSVGGTKVVFVARDKAGNEMENKEYYIRVDGEAPKIDMNRMYVVGSKEDKEGRKIDNKENGGQVVGHPLVMLYADDNLTLDCAKYVIEHNGETIKTDKVDCALNEAFYISIPVDATTGMAEDGLYKVYVTVYDKAGNASEMAIAMFDVDNTEPEFTAEITGAIKGGKRPRPDGTDEYYSSETVSVMLTVKDNNIDRNAIIIKDGSEDVKTPSWSNTDGGIIGKVDISGEGYHRITISGKDKAGNSGVAKSVDFTIDSVAPTVSVKMNGAEYRGNVHVSSNVVLDFAVDDVHVDPEDNYCTVTRTVPGKDPEVSEYAHTSLKYYSFGEDGDYVVKFQANDLADNESDERVVTFRIDKNAPQIQILGASGTTTSDTAVTFVVNETMWQDASCEATIYRKAGDSREELLYKNVPISLTGAETRYQEVLRETGIYRIEMSAKDEIGHTVTLEQQFTLDKNPPVVSMAGVKNYDKTDGAVEFYVEVNDDFFVNKTVSVKGTKTDINGKVEQLDFSNEIVQGANPTIFKKTFDQDGIYDLQVYAKDPSGNDRTDSVHFIIDTEPPVIGDLSKYEDKILREFDWDIDLDELVSDLTVCDVHMYLNGSEYDGSPNIEDGVYTLLIVAEDELGHKTEKSINFTLDTKAPVFIVTGVEDGEIKNEAYKITVSLQLDEDILDSVQLNGSPITISENNTVTIDVTSEGKYELVLHARDIAGNEAEQTISFAFGAEKKTNSIWLIAAIAGGIVVVGGIIFIILAKRRKENY